MIFFKTKLPLYSIILAISMITGMLYLIIELRKNNHNKQIYYYLMIYPVFALYGGKTYTLITTTKKINFFNAGLSSYGALTGVIIGAIIFEKIINGNGEIIKYSILSLPLVYGLSKIACFISGCCGGIPYNGLFKVVYRSGLNIEQFPIQIVETIVFIILFIICNKHKTNKNIVYFTIIICSITKFLLDFLRYEHTTTTITTNQIFSIILIIITLFIYIIKKSNFKRIEIKK